MAAKKIKSALISVFYKDQLEPVIEYLKQNQVKIYSTGGTQEFIQNLNSEVTPIESLTGYPSILGGRVKTLHPKVFGGILARREDPEDRQEMGEFEIPEIDLVIVDLYPFEETLAGNANDQEITEKIDIGGISLIRAAAKNFRDVLVVASRDQYQELLETMEEKNCSSDLEDRKRFAAKAFDVSSHYDTKIFQYFQNGFDLGSFKESQQKSRPLRYGENPHQKGVFFGNLDQLFTQLNGKELSFNNLVDIDAAVNIIAEFKEQTAFAILKHTNACGVAKGSTVREAYLRAFEADTISPFGGVLITNHEVDVEAAQELNSLFFEVLIAPGYDLEALDLLKAKKNRIILEQKGSLTERVQFKSLLNGVILQDKDLTTDSEADLTTVTKRVPDEAEKKALVFASAIAKHTKSNTIVLANDGQMLSSGVGQTSRVDALKQAVEKAGHFGLSLHGAVMASDAFFPFPDCVEIAHQAGITAVIQPGGSKRDQDSIDFCDAHNMAMVTNGIRHFKH